MGGKGDCYDNAPMESFWGTLKTEHVFHRQDETRLQAMRDYRGIYRDVLQPTTETKKLGYISPASFEQKYYEQKLVA